jgi:large subunit ribosomal protein L11
MIIKLLVEGGSMKPGPAISQKLGPLGINLGKVMQDVNKSTESFKGLKVPVELDVNPKTKTFSVKVSSPPVAELIKKELGLELGSGSAKKIKVGNLSIEQVISISKTKLDHMLAKDLKKAVKSVVGSCVSLGILVEDKEAKEIEQDIVAGKYDKEIKEEKTQAAPEKLQKLSQYFAEVKRKQDDMLKKEEEAKAAAEAAAAAQATTAAPAAPGAATAGETAAGKAAAPGAPAAPAEAGKKQEVKEQKKK